MDRDLRAAAEALQRLRLHLALVDAAAVEVAAVRFKRYRIGEVDAEAAEQAVDGIELARAVHLDALPQTCLGADIGIPSGLHQREFQARNQAGALEDRITAPRDSVRKAVAKTVRGHWE